MCIQGQYSIFRTEKNMDSPSSVASLTPSLLSTSTIQSKNDQNTIIMPTTMLDNNKSKVEADVLHDGGVDDNVRTGRWTKQEHSKFMEAYKMFGKDWRKVASYVGTRNNVQVRTHAQKSFKKLMKMQEAQRNKQLIRETLLAKQQQQQQRLQQKRDGEEELLRARRLMMMSQTSPHLTQLPNFLNGHSCFGSSLFSSPLLSPISSQASLTSLPSTMELTSPNAAAAVNSLFRFNGTIFPHLASLPSLASQPPVTPANNSAQMIQTASAAFSPMVAKSTTIAGNGEAPRLKFFQEWTVDCK
jgi:SHAQKYF class myb-like DNA-binding protein